LSLIELLKPFLAVLTGIVLSSNIKNIIDCMKSQDGSVDPILIHPLFWLENIFAGA
jgi:hypothetical protein